MLRKLSLVLLALIIATPAMAVFSQPIAQDASVSPAGTIQLSSGLTLESDWIIFGFRGSYTIIDGLSAFAGLGLADPDGLSVGPYFQAGGSYALPVDLPVDLAIRGGLSYGTFSRGGFDLDVTSLNGGVLASMPVQDMVSVYGFGGLSIIRSKASVSRFGSSSDTDVEPAIAAGAIFKLDANFSFYGELAFIDDLFVSAGARYTF